MTADSSTWMSMNSGLADLNVTDLVSAGGVVFASTISSGVFRLASGASAWVAYSNGLPSQRVLSLAKVEYNNTIYVLAGMRGNVYATYDMGNNWLPPSTMLNLPDYADAIAVQNTSARIFAATPMNSVYSNSSTELPTSIDELFGFENSLGIYPNPSQGEFWVKSTLHHQRGDLQIFNMSGQKVMGWENVDLSVPLKTNLLNGIYIVMLNTADNVYHQKMIVR
jgi:hypothetical protein